MTLTKEPLDSNHFIKPLYYASSARLVFKTILSSIKFGPVDHILLPAYIGITDREGSGVFDPIQELHLNYDFYPVDSKLSLDYDAIVNKKKKPKAILVIHYFGFFQRNILSLRDHCIKEKIILIEDCAHAFNGLFRKDNELFPGQIGNYAFYSIHKYLPTKDGGVGYAKAPFILSSKNHLGDISQETFSQVNLADIDAIKTKRLNNYNYMLKLLRKNNKDYSILHEKLDAETIPLNFPLIIHNKKRENLYFKLIEYKIPVIALYYRLIEQIDKNIHPISYSISQDILNLPTHQDIEIADIELMVTTLHKILDNGEI